MSILNGASNLQGLSDLADLSQRQRHRTQCLCAPGSILNGAGNLQGLSDLADLSQRRRYRTQAISGKDSPSSVPSPWMGEGQGRGCKGDAGHGETLLACPPYPNLPAPGWKEHKKDMHGEKSP
jgi:hypothetical protein